MAKATRVLRVLEDRPHLVLPCPRDPTGLTGPTPAETRGPSWRRTSWDRYVPVSIEQTIEQRILEAATLLPAHGALTGWAALYWMGATRWFNGAAADGLPMPVWLAIGGEHIRPQPGVAVCAERLDPRDVIVVDGVRVTTAVRSVCFEMRYAASLGQAAVTLSMAAYYDLVSIAELTQYADKHSGWTGIPRCRAAAPLAEENCWSPTEVDMVLAWRLDAGFPRPLCNRPLFDRAGQHLGTPDLLDVEAGVAGEYEGAVHLTGARRSSDVRREERYRGVGLEYFTMLGPDRAEHAAMAERMSATRARASWTPEASRLWTAEPPPWWTPTHSVELRRALTASQRRRFLRYRAA